MKRFIVFILLMLAVGSSIHAQMSEKESEFMKQSYKNVTFDNNNVSSTIYSCPSLVEIQNNLKLI